ncbi:hypothetical protein Q5O14_10460 [Eubacteriaceae bacterium ES2]|nr:hypothetical protein Q5O14_10460 [Eubacteriaceae bacterium ES2]
MKGKRNWKIILLATITILMLISSQAFAAVAPSIAGTSGPTLVTFTAPDGTLAIGSYVDANGVTHYIPAGDGSVVITSDSDYEATLTGQDLANYIAARDQLLNTGSDFYTDLDSFIAENFPDYSGDDFAVRDIIDVGISDDLRAATFEQGYDLQLTFDTDYTEGDVIVVIVYNAETGGWDFIASDDVVVNPDGTVTVTFPHLCPVAFLAASVETASYTEATTAEEPTNTANSLVIPILAGIGVLIIVASLVISKMKKSS